ncbi:MAG: hypothetical protein V2I65_12285, partial [Paracoccaceae bacterium]|nr:hypothetical protein [Paracoccaceae bacterium]
MGLRINEIVVSTTGVDREFLELFGTPGQRLEGFSIVQVRSGGEIADVIQLGGVVGINGHFLLASPEAESVLGVEGDQQIADNTFTNGSRTHLLVEGDAWSVGGDIDVNDDGVADSGFAPLIVDGIAVIGSDSPLVYAPNVVGPDGSFLAPGGYRDPVGTGGFLMHSFSDPSLYSPTASVEVAINEIVVSTTGTDKEFIEFVGLPGTDLSGLTLLEIEPGGEIDTVLPLTGTVGGNGHYLVSSPAAEAALGVTGDQSMPDNTFTNGSRTYLLVDGFTGTGGDDIDIDDDGVIDSAPWGAIVDSVAPIGSVSPLIYSANVIGPDGAFLSPGGYRDPAASGGFEQHDFFDARLYSPNASAPFAINEIVVSTTGTEKEFIEFVGLPGTDLSGLTLLEIEPGG